MREECRQTLKSHLDLFYAYPINKMLKKKKRVYRLGFILFVLVFFQRKKNVLTYLKVAGLLGYIEMSLTF